MSDGTPGFDVRATSLDDVVVLAVRGAVDALTAPQFAQAISDAFDAGSGGVVVDFSELDFLGSAGMSVLVHGQRAATAAAQTFGVVADGPATSRPMKVIGLDDVIQLYPTLDDALASRP